MAIDWAPGKKKFFQPVECPVLQLCEPLYVGVESQHRVRLSNAAWYPLRFSWGCPVGEQRNALKITLCPLASTIPPTTTITVCLTLTPLLEGNINDLYIPCLSTRLHSPIYLQIICTVETIHVTFELPTSHDYAKQHLMESVKFRYIHWFSGSIPQPRKTACDFLGTDKDTKLLDGNMADKNKHHTLKKGTSNRPHDSFRQHHQKNRHKSNIAELEENEISRGKASELNYGSLSITESLGMLPTLFRSTVEFEPNILLPVYEPKVKHRSSVKTIEDRKMKYGDRCRRTELQIKKSVSLSEKEIKSMFNGFSRGAKKRKKFLKRSQEELIRKAELEHLKYIYRITSDSFIVMVPLSYCREIKQNATKMLTVSEEIMPVRYKSRSGSYSDNIVASSHSQTPSKGSEHESTIINIDETETATVTTDAYSSISLPSSTLSDGISVTEEMSSRNLSEDNGNDEKSDNGNDEKSDNGNDEKSISPFLKNIILDAMPVKYIIELQNVPCSQAIKTMFIIRNETLIASSVRLSIKNFTEEEKKPQLNVIAEAKKKVYGIIGDDWKSSVKEGKGIVVKLQPLSSHLAPKSALPVDIWVYGHTWGTYYDEITCSVDGLPPFYIHLMVQVVGPPASFALREDVKTSVPTLCFGTLPYHSQCKTRKVCVRNKSCLMICILWHIFVTEPLEDNKPENDPFNLVFDVCSQFSKQKNNVKYYKPSHAETSSKCSSCKTMQFPFGVMDSFIQFGIIPFQGREQYKFFQVFPKETILEPFGETTLKLTVNPCICDQDTRFTPLRAVLAGFIQISEEDRYCADTYEREMGYGLSPLKMKIEADIEIPYLCLETPEKDCNFNMYATDVMNKLSKTYKEEKVISVKNYNNAQAVVAFSTDEPFTLCKISTTDGMISKRGPGEAVVINKNVIAKITVLCQVNQNYVGEALLALQDPKSKELITSKDQKVVEFEGAISVTQDKFLHQYIPVKISIIFPTVHVSEELLDFGKVCKGQTKEMILTLKNNTEATISMEFILRNDDKNFSVRPTEGVLYPASSGKNSVELRVQFSSAQANNMPFEDALLIVTRVPQDFFEVELTATAVSDQKFSLIKC